jgi:hypothetical protein
MGAECAFQRCSAFLLPCICTALGVIRLQASQAGSHQLIIYSNVITLLFLVAYTTGLRMWQNGVLLVPIGSP